MAITKQYIRQEGLSATHNVGGQDSVTRTYRTKFDGPQTDQVAVFEAQLAATIAGDITAKPPQDGGQFSAATAAYLFAKTFTITPVNNNLSVWDTVVVWTTPDPGTTGNQLQPNPLLRPPVFNVEYIEVEYPIELGQNLQALAHGGADGTLRAAFTNGDLVNAAGKRPDEPQMDTERNAVLTIERNYPSLADIVAVNLAFHRTTNLGNFQGFASETLKYMVTDSIGQRTEGDFTYFPGVTRIEQKETTLRVIQNKGYAYFDDDAQKFIPGTPGDPDASPPVSATEDKWEPISGGGVWEGKDPISDLWNLKLDGTRIDKDNPAAETWIQYRYLKRIPYAPLLV